MTEDQERWFVNGGMWVLVVLRDMGIDVKEEKFVAFLSALVDGSVTRTPSPAELRIQVEKSGMPVTDEFMEHLQQIDPDRRRKTAETDREAAKVLLKLYGHT